MKQKKSGDDPFYFWFLEFGFTLPNGRIVKYPFLTPAVRESAQAALDQVARYLQRKIVAEQQRFNRSGEAR